MSIMLWRRKKPQRSNSDLAAGLAYQPANAGYTPVQLQDCNDLTRLSAIPGQLDYETYVQYLAFTGHVQSHQRFGLDLPRQPLKSSLQNQEEAQSAQEASEAMDGACPDNEAGVPTSWRADQALWSEQNLPEILYCFDRPELWLTPKDLREPPLKSYRVNGFQLRDIPILPDHVSLDLEGWRHVAWTRMDPRISSKDITDRMGLQSNMTANPRSRKKLRCQNSTIQMRTARFREDFPALGWVKKGGNFDKDRRKLKTRLQVADINLNRNTTRGVSWGLVDTTKGESGGRIPVAETKSWPNSVEQQPELLPNLPTSLPVTATRLFPGFTNNGLCYSSQLSFNRAASQIAPSLTPEPHLRMPFSKSLGRCSLKRENSSKSPTRRYIKRESSSSNDLIMDTPRKRRKTQKLEAANGLLTPISELLSSKPQPPVEVSDKDIHQSLYVRSAELNNRFGHLPQSKGRTIPDDVLKSAEKYPSTATATSHLASKEAFKRKLQDLTAQAEAKNASKAQLVQSGQDTSGNNGMVTIEHGGATLNLKNDYQRRHLSQEARVLLFTFHPAGCKERNLQLEYLLDPNRAPFGFQDCNGYEAPVAGVDLTREIEYNIWYHVTTEEALGQIKRRIA